MTTYFIADDQWRIKIGRTAKESPNCRMNDGQTWHAARLVLLGTVDGDREAELHLQFAKYRLRGEWFACVGDLAAFLLAAFKTSPSPRESAFLARELAHKSPTHGPRYRLHRRSGLAVVTLNVDGRRKDVMLGKFGSPESISKYEAVTGFSMNDWINCRLAEIGI